MTREEVLEKIKKLLALSRNNPSEQEATAAALKAQKLMAEYDIEEVELADKCEEMKFVETKDFIRRGWRGHLASVVAENFRCRSLLKRYPNYDFRVTRNSDPVVQFYGYAMDAEAAALVFEYLYKVGDRLANKKYREYKELGYSTAGVYNSFVGGFVVGVASELEKQSLALMLVVPKEVNESFDAFEFGTCSYNLSVQDSEAYDEGFVAGRDSVRERRMDSGSSDYMLEG